LLRISPNEIITQCGFPHSADGATVTAIAIAEPSNSAKPAWRWIGLLSLLFAASLIAATVYGFVYEREAKNLVEEAQVAAQLQAEVLKSELEKQRSVPAILAMDTDLIESVHNPSLQHSLAISKKLELVRRDTRGAVIYVIDKNGRTLSASNYAAPDSFVGQNFSFRRYFSEALKHGDAEQFALGSVSKRPGLYFAHRIEKGTGPSGVVVVKLEFDEIETSWRRASTRTFVTDSSHQILLTSVPKLRFQKLPLVAPDQIVTSLPAPIPGWILTVYSSRKDAIQSARSATLIAILVEILLAVLLLWLSRRRKHIAERATAEASYRVRLEQDVARRTQELRAVNDLLSKEIAERQQAERRLNILQADLVQANKLAQLGQITAGVAHEINQPLGAIRILADNCLALLGKKDSKASTLIGNNLDTIVRLNERIGHITRELRAFSRKGNRETGPISLKDALNSAILLNQSRLRENKVKLIRDPFDPKTQVIGGRIRLEQVLVNLLQNAFEALEDSPRPQIRISVVVEGDWVLVRIIDNGPGLPPEVANALFTPFTTTKENGLGLGLVIAHDIVRDLGGELTAESTENGTTFTVKLKKVQP
jgi:two-component system C4-dicarboxylate transport sensor histidine kinase DctB